VGQRIVYQTSMRVVWGQIQRVKYVFKGSRNSQRERERERERERDTDTVDKGKTVPDGWNKKVNKLKVATAHCGMYNLEQLVDVDH